MLAVKVRFTVQFPFRSSPDILDTCLNSAVPSEGTLLTVTHLTLVCGLSGQGLPDTGGGRQTERIR